MKINIATELLWLLDLFFGFALLFFLIILPILIMRHVKKILTFLKNYHKKIIALIVIGVVFCCIVFYYQKLQEIKTQEKVKKIIIEYCETFRWENAHHIEEAPLLFSFEDVSFLGVDRWSYRGYIVCEDFLHIKPKVKKSNTSICHDEGSTYYYKTKAYEIFESMDECLNSGGRKPYN